MLFWRVNFVWGVGGGGNWDNFQGTTSLKDSKGICPQHLEKNLTFLSMDSLGTEIFLCSSLVLDKFNNYSLASCKPLPCVQYPVCRKWQVIFLVEDFLERINKYRKLCKVIFLCG